MHKVLAVAWREFKHTALTKAFIIGTIIFPLLLWGGFAGSALLIRPTVAPLEATVAIVDPSGAVIEAAKVEMSPDRLARSLLGRMGEAIDGDAAEMLGQAEQYSSAFAGAVDLNVHIEAHDDEEALPELHERLRRGELFALAIIAPEALEAMNRGGVTMFVQTQANPDHVDAIRRAIGQSVVRARADQAALDVDDLRRLVRPPQVSTRRLTDEGEAPAGDGLQRALPIAFMVLLWISAFASGNYLLTSTIEEKSNKVMEVLLSAVSPLQLMTGKILGQAIVGLFTIAVYGALGIAALSFFAMADLIEVRQIIYLGLYFFMAYFIVASIMAAIGSAVSDLQEAHSLITPAMLILILPMILFVPVSQNPNGTLAVVTSFIPVLTPFVMIVRVTATEPVAAWQIAASMVVGYGGVVLMVWMAARIFRVGVLMYGKPPSPIELLKWLRYS